MKTGIRLLALAWILASFFFPSFAQALNGYVGCSYSDSADPFDLDSYEFGPSIDLLPYGDYPYDATIRPNGSELWIPGASGDGVVVVDRDTGLITHTIPVGEYPVSVAFSANNAFALVSCRDGEGLWKVDATTYSVVATTPLPTGYQGAGNIALDPVSGLFYVVDWYDELLYEIAADGETLLRQVNLGVSLWQLVVSADGTYIYVTDRGTDQVRVLDRASLTEIEVWDVGDDPWGIDITLDGSTLVVACEDSHEVWLLDPELGPVDLVFLHAQADPRDVDILDYDGLAFVAGGQITGADPVYLLQINGSALLVVDMLDAPGSNANVIAVQPQMPWDGSDVAESPGVLRLSAHPNPFNPKTEIRFNLDWNSNLNLAIYDSSGRKVRELAGGFHEAGEHRFEWDGLGDAGDRLASGVYLVNLSGDFQSERKKVVLLK